MPVAQRVVDIAVPPAALMAVICDFASYPRFLPDMDEATVLRAEPDRWTVQFAVRIIRRVEYTLLLTRVSPLALSWSLVEGAFKANTGGWLLAPLDGGARTRATYTLDLDIGMFVPGSVLKTLLEHNLPATLDAFKARAEGGA
jgi:ribosome-associated toxin RatA of RatAB toxin-antitoxin module